MKLHYKEWPCVTLIHDGSKVVTLETMASQILPHRRGTWRTWDRSLQLGRLYLFRSGNRYFQFGGPSTEFASYFEDSVYPRAAGRTSTGQIEYPIYYLSAAFGHRLICAISAPYAGLLAELFADISDDVAAEGFSFLTPKIRKIYDLALAAASQPPPKSAAEAFAPDRKTFVFRGGRLALKPLTDDKNRNKRPTPELVRSLVIVGENILQSSLFARLTGEGFEGIKFDIDDALAKVAFQRGLEMGVVVKMDRFGNYHFRPGFGGKNLDSFVDLLQFCRTGKALDETNNRPFRSVVASDY